MITFKSNILCLLYLIFNRKYHALHFFDLCGFNIALARAMKFFSTRTILTIAFTNYAYGWIDEKTKEKLVTLLNECDKIDVLYPAGKEYLHSISTNKDISITPGTFTNIDIFRREKKEKLVLFAAARLEKVKNAVLLINACNICKNFIRNLGYTIYICGKGFEEKYLNNKINEYGIEDIVKMIGYVKISDIMPKTEIFVSLSLEENYPSQALAEATACGCAVICTDVGYSRMCGEGIFIEYITNDSRMLAEKLVKFMKLSFEEKNIIEKSARAYAKIHYSISKSASYFEKLLWD